ncbi:MAG: alanine racemase [Sedimentisphaerales bacterium]|nr:alanine racemase [Sedimentisphaerales bacterium]
MKVYPAETLIRPDLQAHIFSEALLHNVQALRSLCAEGTYFCAVVKANAYGHGLPEIVNILRQAEVDFFAVASIYEAIHIASIVQEIPTLILEPIHPAQPPDQIVAAARNGFHCVVATSEAIDFLSDILAGSGDVLDLHVNVESGMGRCGIDPEQAASLIRRIDRCSNARLAGVYTHFATADEDDLSYAWQQLEQFERFLDQNRIRHREDVLVHAANSAATIKIPQAHFDMVRCGISMYGYYSRRMAHPPISLQPVMRLQAPVVQIKHLPAGHSVSYGRSFVPFRDTIAALIPLGYADGYWRCFSNRARMKVGNAFVPVIGRVCMDQLLLDVTDVPDIAPGQMVTVIDNEHDSPCGVYALADLAGTICYEILTCVHAHINRIVH